MISIIVTARDAALDPTATIAKLREIDSAEILLAGQMRNPPPDLPQFNDPNHVAARNAALKAAKGEIVCLIDADCIPTADWHSQLLAPFNDPDVVGVKGTFATQQTNLVARFVQSEYEDKYRRLLNQPSIDFIDTYSAAYRRQTLLNNDGFDPTFPALEDQELSFRLAARGYKLVFEPLATVHKEHPASFSAYLHNKLRIGYWKAQVVRRFPTQAITDSHTPQVIKLQMILAALLGISLLLLPIDRTVPLVVCALFLASMLPFVGRVSQQNRQVALISPLLLAARAFALGFGYVWGLLRPQRGISGQQTTIGGLNYVAKRLIDIMGGLAGCIILLALYPFVALAIKRNSSGPIFFRQVRIGQGGKAFTCYKFRTMQADAEAQLDKLIDIDALAEPAFKLADDPRVTAVGRTLRRWSIDEVPQFWNILRGDMSLIGPRPEEERIVAKYNAWQRRRLSVKPGLSGPMQVNGRGDLSLNERVELEVEYIENYSVWRDVRILMQTFPAVFSGDGAR